MATIAPYQRPDATRLGRPIALLWLVALLGLLAIGALQGGIAMVLDPIEPLGMSVSYLVASPVDTYFWPGVFLLAIAAASIVTIAGLLLRWEWPWANRIEISLGHRWPWLGALATGAVLLVFELIELFVVPFHPVMHPLLIIGSLAIIALVLVPPMERYLRVAGR